MREELERLENTSQNLDRQNREMTNAYENRIEEMESNLEEVNTMTKRELYKAEEFKIERKNEIKRYRKVIQDLEEELRQRGEKNSALLEEKNRIIDLIRDLQRELASKNDEMEKYKQEVSIKSAHQTREVEQLHTLLTKSYKTVNQSLEKSRENEPESDIQKSMNELKKLENYLSQRSPRRQPLYASMVKEKTSGVDNSPNRHLAESANLSLRDRKPWASNSKY